MYCASGGGTSGGNHVSGDPALYVATSRAIDTANNKFSSTDCSEELFKEAKLSDGTTLYSVLQQRGSTASSWLATIDFRNGTGVHDANNQTPCDTAPAWTTTGSQQAYVCTALKNVGVTTAADTIIHELLHTLGLRESNPYNNEQGALTPQQIQEMVVRHCGS